MAQARSVRDWRHAPNTREVTFLVTLAKAITLVLTGGDKNAHTGCRSNVGTFA